MPDMASALDEALPMAEDAVAGGAQMLFLPEYCGGLVTDGPAVRPPSRGLHNCRFAPVSVVLR